MRAASGQSWRPGFLKKNLLPPTPFPELFLAKLLFSIWDSWGPSSHLRPPLPLRPFTCSSSIPLRTALFPPVSRTKAAPLPFLLVTPLLPCISMTSVSEYSTESSQISPLWQHFLKVTQSPESCACSELRFSLDLGPGKLQALKASRRGILAGPTCPLALRKLSGLELSQLTPSALAARPSCPPRPWAPHILGSPMAGRGRGSREAGLRWRGAQAGRGRYCLGVWAQSPGLQASYQTSSHCPLCYMASLWLACLPVSNHCLCF